MSKNKIQNISTPLLLNEKYDFNDIFHQKLYKNVIKKIRTCDEEYIKNLPNFLLIGKKGVGKTSFAKKIVEEVYQRITGSKIKFGKREIKIKDYKNTYKKNKYETSQISIMYSCLGNKGDNNFLKDYVQKYSRNNTFNKINIKFVILKDAHKLKKNVTQSMLRRMLEDYSHITKYIFITNNNNKLIQPLVSRFSIISMKGITKKNTKKFLKKLEEKNAPFDEIYNSDSNIGLMYEKINRSKIDREMDLRESWLVKIDEIINMIVENKKYVSNFDKIRIQIKKLNIICLNQDLLYEIFVEKIYNYLEKNKIKSIDYFIKELEEINTLYTHGTRNLLKIESLLLLLRVIIINK